MRQLPPTDASKVRWLKALLILSAPFALLAMNGEPALTTPAPVGDFEASTDVGVTPRTGSAQFDSYVGEYRVVGGGHNMWDREDAFHFVWRRMSGDLTLSANVQLLGTGTHAHRKAGWVVRQSLEPDSPYVSVVVHADGLTTMQYRRTRGAITEEVRSPISMPLGLSLSRRGDEFSFAVAKSGELEKREAPIKLALGDPLHVGLAVCSHNVEELETALFWHVRIEGKPPSQHSKPTVESSLEIISADGKERRTVYRAREHFEAPSWSRDGKYLLFNSTGRLFTVPVEGGFPKLLDTGFAIRCNNDHGFSPDGKLIALSHSPAGQSLIYVMPATGGEPRMVVHEGPAYWHGWSPDGKALAYVAERGGNYDIYSIPVEGGEERRLTDAPGLDDGPDYTADGEYIYFNSERTGQMQIWRMRSDGSGQEQVTFVEYQDWFPHPSPDGKWLVFLSYEKDVTGHPPNKDVMLRILPLEGGEPRILVRLFGGQGTINVPAWSPDGKYFAFVSYRLLD